MTGIASVDERYKKNITALDGSIKRDVDASNATHKKQADTLTALYEGQMAESGAEYDDLERQNAVQKLINEREVEENMANLGLTDSGLNRTQQTAVQLSAANNSAKIAREKQAMYNAFKRELTSRLADNEASRASAEASIRSGYEKQAMDAAVSSYNTDVDAWQKNYEAGLKAAQKAAEAQKITKLNYGTLAGTYNTSNNNVVYSDGEGNEVTMRQGANPYTNTVNKDVLDSEGNYDKSKVFSNGYQPNNYKGTPLKKADKKVNKTTVPWRDDGVEQQVWMADGKYYLWHGPSNKYVQARYNSKEEAWEFKL